MIVFHNTQPWVPFALKTLESPENLQKRFALKTTRAAENYIGLEK
jgi:hypothetical protein